MTTDVPAGLVVAGGYSTRCGIAEKALLEVDGEPMLRRVADALSPVVDAIVVGCREDQVSPFGTALEPLPLEPRFAVDEEPDAGPIAGLASGLEVVDAPETLVVSCDRPGATAALFEHLLRARRRESAAAALPALDGRLQPLCGGYETGALAGAVEAAIRAEDRRLCRVPRRLSRRVVAGDALAEIVDPGQIRSVDTPLEIPCLALDGDRADGAAAFGTRSARGRPVARPGARSD